HLRPASDGPPAGPVLAAQAPRRPGARAQGPPRARDPGRPDPPAGTITLAAPHRPGDHGHRRGRAAPPGGGDRRRAPDAHGPDRLRDRAAPRQRERRRARRRRARGPPRRRDRPRPPEARHLGLHRIGVPLLRDADLDLHGLSGTKPAGAVSARHPERAADHGEHVHPPHVEPHDGARGGGDPGPGRARRAALGPRDRRAGGPLPRGPGVRVQPLRPRGPRTHDEPVRRDLLRHGGLPRRPRHRGRDLAVDALVPPDARAPRRTGRDARRHGGALLALRRRRVGRGLHAGLPDPVGAAHGRTTGGRTRRGTAGGSGHSSGDQGPRAESGLAAGAAHGGAGPRTYLVVAAFLLAITVMEVWIFYVPALARVLVPVLLILSTLKFSLVAMFYMHLRFDHAWFSYAFVGPLIIVIALAVALLSLF